MPGIKEDESLLVKHEPEESTTTSIAPQQPSLSVVISKALSMDVFKSAIKVVPKVGGFGRRTTGLGAAPHLRHTPLASASTGIRILGIYCADDYFKIHGVGVEDGHDSQHARSHCPRGVVDDTADKAASTPPSTCGVSSSSSSSFDSHSGGMYSYNHNGSAKRPREEMSTLDIPAATKGEQLTAGCPPRQGASYQWRTDAAGARRVYVRFLVDKTLEATLPLVVMRERYPEVLIDYLLSTAAYV